MTDFLILATLLAFVVLGLRHPAIAFAGYTWTDLAVPQNISVGIALSFQFSMIMAVVCILSMLINFRKLRKPGSTATFVLILLFLVWMFFTTSWASNPAQAAFKLDWASKSLGFILLGFFIISTRRALELYLASFVACVGYYALQVGIKTMAGGAAYGKTLIFGANNNGLVESSTLGGVAVACIPIIIYLTRCSVIFDGKRFATLGNITCVLFAIGVIGTHSRTGLVCLALLGLIAFILTDRKLIIGLIIALSTAGAGVVAGEEWVARMSTISSSEQDASAVGRLVVWQWTWDYAKSNPLGGGFYAYLDNAGVLNTYIAEDNNVVLKNSAKAFHNVFFEVLGEQGYIGLFLYLSIVLLTLKKLTSLVLGRKSIDEEHRWIVQAGTALFIGYLMILATAMFVGVAYRSYLFLFTLGAVFLHQQWLAVRK